MLAEHDPSYEDIATKFFEHFAYIAAAAYEQGLWDERGRLLLRRAAPAPTAAQVPLKVRSVVGLLPLAATTSAHAPRPCTGCRSWAPGCAGSSPTSPEYADVIGARRLGATAGSAGCCPLVGPEQLVRILRPDAGRGGVPLPVRAAHAVARLPGPAVHGDPRRADVHRRLRAGRVHQRHCSAATPTGGARSGSRPTSSSSRRCASSPRFFGDDLTVEYPDRLRRRSTPSTEIADDLARRLISLFLPDEHGRRPDLRRLRTVPDPPGLAGPAGLPRVLPRRQRRRAGRLAPDRLDRPGRRPGDEPIPPLTAGAHGRANRW